MKLATDPTGSVTFVDPAWESWTGQSVQDAMGSGWLDKIHPSDRGIVIERLEEASRKEEQLIITYRLFLQKGDFRWVTTRIVPRLVANTGEFDGLWGTIVLEAKLVDFNDARHATGGPQYQEEATPIELLADQILESRHLAYSLNQSTLCTILYFALLEIGFLLASQN